MSKILGFRCQCSALAFPDTSYETTVSFSIKLAASMAGLGLNSKQIERRTSNIERRILMTLRFIDFKTSEPQSATSLSVVSSGSNDSRSNDSPRRARDLSLSKAAELNFEG
jgi:hypothetical protein